MSEGNRIGIIGLGLMGRELVSAVLRWAHLVEDIPRPEITGICSPNDSSHEWFRSALPSLAVDTTDYERLLASPDVDIVYVAVPHNLHAEIYTAAIESGKDLFGEKPFGIDQEANQHIVSVAAGYPNRFVRCASQFAFYPPVQRMISEIQSGQTGRILEVRAGFHHSSDLDLTKPLNWKRRIATNGEYGCMGDLGFHVMYVPFRLGWNARSVSAVLSDIATERPGADGTPEPCETWDNATLLCEAVNAGPFGDIGEPFPMTFEMKRMMPGATNTWFLEVYGMHRSYRYSTTEPRTLYFCDNSGRSQAWARLDMGYETPFKTISGHIFEFGFPDAIQQMLAAFVLERAGTLDGRFGTGRPEETLRSHAVMTAALRSQNETVTVPLAP